jgi:hypothetical protein
MLSRVCAAWLVAIIAVPFTAPMATCDVADILLRTPQNSGAPTAPSAPSADRNSTTTPTLITAPGQLRLNVVTDTIVASTAEADIFVATVPAFADPVRAFERRSEQRRILRL